MGWGSTALSLFLILPGGTAGAATTSAPHSEEVRFTSGSNELSGTLMHPEGADADCPAVVVLAGSDRSARGKFRVRIAEQFAAHGIAALVYDSPGTGGSTGNARLQTLDDRANEALAAADYLRGLPGIDGDAVGVFGGSEGANVALIAGARDARTAFVIAVSGSMGTSVLDVLRYSAEKRGYALGLTEDEIARAVTFKEIAFAILSGADIVEWSLVERRIARWENEAWEELIDVAKKRHDDLSAVQKQAMLDSFRRVVDELSAERWFGAVDAAGAVQRFARLNADSFFALLEHGPYARDWDHSLCAAAAAIRCPVLGIWGAEDSFLPPRQSAARLEKMLSDAGHTDHTIRIFDGAGHFLTTSGPDADFIPGYVELLARWVADRRGVR